MFIFKLFKKWKLFFIDSFNHLLYFPIVSLKLYILITVKVITVIISCRSCQTLLDSFAICYSKHIFITKQYINLVLARPVLGGHYFIMLENKIITTQIFRWEYHKMHKDFLIYLRMIPLVTMPSRIIYSHANPYITTLETNFSDHHEY